MKELKKKRLQSQKTKGRLASQHKTKLPKETLSLLTQLMTITRSAAEWPILFYDH